MSFFLFIFVILFFVFLLLFLVFGIIFAKGKGKRGEKRVSKKLTSLGDDFIVIDDLMIQYSNEKTSQIDHVVLSEYGIFVVETKNYQGWIFGKEYSEEWTQVIYNDKFKFRNPIKQNLSHIYALKETLSDFPNLRYIPIVAFAGSATLKDVETTTSVVYASEIKQTILKQCCEKTISKEDLEKIRSILVSNNIIEKQRKKEHVQQIKQSIVEKEIKKENLICPHCNGELKLRKGKYSSFYGCSNYPLCKFTMPK